MESQSRDPLPDFRPTERLRASNPAAQDTDGLVIAGYVTGVLVPPVGFFLGFALVLKDRVAHGVAIMLVAVAVSVGTTALVLSSGDASTSDSVSDCIEQALLPEDC